MGQNPIEGSNPSLSANIIRPPMKPLFIVVLLAGVFAAFPARAELFACTGADGRKSFTTNPNDSNCVRHPSYESGAPGSQPPRPAILPPPTPTTPTAPSTPTAPATPPAAKTAPPKPPTRVNIPNVAPREQSVRDIRRRDILVYELRREMKSRETFLAQIAQAKSEKTRAFFRRLVRVHELNILAIRRELDLLGGSSARN